MREQIVGLFLREESAGEAAGMLHAAGYGSFDLDLVGDGFPKQPDLHKLLHHVRLGRLLQRPEGMWPCALRWALIGSIVVEIPVLVWVLLAFDSWGIQVLLGSTIWKVGTLFGAILGAIAGKERGLESRDARRYETSLAQGALGVCPRNNILNDIRH